MVLDNYNMKKLFCKFLVLMYDPQKDKYDYGMTLVLFNFLVMFYTTPLFILFMKYYFSRLNLFHGLIFFNTLIFLIIYHLTKYRHKDFFNENETEYLNKNKYKVLLLYPAGFIYLFISIYLIRTFI